MFSCYCIVLILKGVAAIVAQACRTNLQQVRLLLLLTIMANGRPLRQLVEGSYLLLKKTSLRFHALFPCNPSTLQSSSLLVPSSLPCCIKLMPDIYAMSLRPDYCSLMSKSYSCDVSMAEDHASPMAIDSPSGTYIAQNSQDHTFSTRLIVAPPVKFGYGRKVDFLARLPYELSSRVVSFLDFQSLLSISRVSSQWRAIYFDNGIWRQQMIERGWGVQLPAEIQSWDDQQINWYYLFTQKYQLLQRWRTGQAVSQSLVGHSQGVYCLQFDQEKLVTGSRDRTIKFWDMATHQCVRTLQGHQGSVLCLKYNDDIMVSGSSDTTIIVWNMRTLQIMKRLKGHQGGVLDVCFDERYVVSGSKDGTIRIWDISSGNLVRVISDHRGPVNTLQLHGDQIVSGSSDATVRMWNITTGTCMRRFDGHRYGVACVRYDGSQVVSGSNDRTIKVWDAETGKCTMTLAGHEDLIRTLQFADGKIVSAGYDQNIRVWDMTTGVCLLEFKMQPSWIFNVQFDKNRIISVGHDCKIQILNFAYGLDTRYIT